MSYDNWIEEQCRLPEAHDYAECENCECKIVDINEIYKHPATEAVLCENCYERIEQ